MASFSQIRLQQLSGSAVDVKTHVDNYIVPDTAAALTGSDALDLLGMIAASVQRIHGQASDEVFNAAAGNFYQDLLVGPSGDKKVQFRDSGIFINSSADGQLDIDADGEVEIASAKLDFDASSDFVITGGAASTVETSAGNLTIDSKAANLVLDGHTGVDIDATNSGKVSIDGAGGIDIGVAADVAIDIDASTLDIDTSDNITITAGGSGKLVDIDASGTLSLDSATGIDIGKAADKPIDIDSTTLDIDASGAITMDGAGVAIAGGANASSFNVATGGADEKDLTISVTGGGNSSLLLTSAGTGTDALSLDATAGDVVLAPSLANEKTLKLGNAASVQAIFAPSATAGNEKFTLTNVAGNDQEAIKLFAPTGGLVLSGATGKKVRARAGAIEIESTGNNAGAIKLHANTGTSETIFIHNQLGTDGKAVEILAEAGGVDLFTQAAGKNVAVRAELGGVQLSGSLGIGLSGSVAFSSDGAMRAAAGLQTGTMAFANNGGEFATFRSKDIFTRETSVIGALNALAAASESGGVVGRKVLAAALAANTNLTLNNAALDDAGGFADQVNTTNVIPANTEVYVNGQLLLSGTSVPGASVVGGDYTFNSPSAPGIIRFGFALEVDDVLVIKTSAVQ